MAEDLFCWTDYKVHSPMYDDPCRWLISISAEVSVNGGEDDELEEEVIAKANFIYAELDEAASEGYDPMYVLDIQSETAPYMSLFERDEDEFELCAPIRDDKDAIIFGWNLLIFHDIEISPSYRGRGLTRRIWEDALRVFGGHASVAALHAVPHGMNITNENIDNWDWSIKPDTLEVCDLKALNSVRVHFSKLGFKMLGRGDLMYMLV